MGKIHNRLRLVTLLTHAVPWPRCSGDFAAYTSYFCKGGNVLLTNTDLWFINAVGVHAWEMPFQRYLYYNKVGRIGPKERSAH